MRILLLIALVIAGFSAGCRKPSVPRAAGETELVGATAGANLLLITMDTTRADRIGCYGWSRAVTPSLDALAAAGVRFDQAFTPVPITLPSHSTIMTGVLPPEHGVRDNGRYVLGPALPTLAELLAQHGYRTGAFVAAKVLDARYGLNRGFETYDDVMTAKGDGPVPTNRAAQDVSTAALAWLSSVGGDRFFCWVHFFDPHAPYVSPPEYLAQTGDPYDGEIAYMDSHIGRLLDWLAANGLRDKTIIVAVGDHGESLGEHGYNWHALLVYESTMRVPLIVSLPGRLPEGRRCDGLVSTADLFPTLVRLFGWNVPSSVSGQSLLAEMGGGAIQPRALYGESDYPLVGFGWSPLRSLTGPDWKYIRAPRAELYDRHSDRAELNNVAAAHPEVVEHLEDELRDIELGLQLHAASAPAPDAATLAELRSLGYVGSGAPLSAQGPLRDPKDMVPIDHAYLAAQSLATMGDGAAALKLLEPAVAASPESYVLVELLGRTYAIVGRTAEAERMLRQALALWPESAEAWAVLAQVLAELGRMDDAESAARKAILFDSRSATAQRASGDVAVRLGRIDDAIAAYQRVIESEPTVGQGYIALAHLYQARGDVPAAVAILRRGETQCRGQAEVANDLAWLLATAARPEWRDAADAVRLAEQACHATGQRDANMLDTLAAAYAEAGRFDDALRTLDRALERAKQVGASEAALGELHSRRTLYERHEPYRVVAPPR